MKGEKIMKKTKEQKAITLIALIITIVVLLILAAVAISSIQNDGILKYTENVANKYNQAQKDEQGVLDSYLEYFNGGATSEIPEILERYVLGAEKTGRALTDIMNMETMAFLDDEETTEVDESTLVTFLNIGQNENMTKRICICKI